MRRQPHPIVNMDDVERIVRRDYPPEMVADILREIDGIDAWEKTRVVLACLKIANGDRRRLHGELQNASGWFREILSEAEYPLATKRMFRMDAMSEEERSAIYQRDWDQYVAWLGRDPVPTPEQDG